MRDYELGIIIYPEAEEEDVAAVVEKLGQIIVDSGGQVTRTDMWGKRKLAYPIRKFKEGYYVFMQTQLEQEGIEELERNLKLTEEIIRYLFVRISE